MKLAVTSQQKMCEALKRDRWTCPCCNIVAPIGLQVRHLCAEFIFKRRLYNPQWWCS